MHLIDGRRCAMEIKIWDLATCSDAFEWRGCVDQVSIALITRDRCPLSDCRLGAAAETVNDTLIETLGLTSDS